jgi:uncharacterized protein
MPFQQDIVLLFTRYPAPGLSKTRLIPALGEQGAADLQRRMTERIVGQTLLLAGSHPHRLEIHYDGGSLSMMERWLGKTYTYKHQQGEDLGARMASAMAIHLIEKTAILLAGSDCPEITAPLLAEALEAVRRNDMVIGPAHDGGYYLIGVQGALPLDILHDLFTDIAWGSTTVFADTMARADHHQLSSHILPKLHDIDRPEDLGYLNYHPGIE